MNSSRPPVQWEVELRLKFKSGWVQLHSSSISVSLLKSLCLGLKKPDLYAN